MIQEQDYVNYFYAKYEGRVTLGVGYDQNLSEIYPFVYEDIAGRPIGAAALGVYRRDSINYVHIYHIGSFKSNRGDGNQILQALCLQADKYQRREIRKPLHISSGKPKYHQILKVQIKTRLPVCFPILS